MLGHGRPLFTNRNDCLSLHLPSLWIREIRWWHYSFALKCNMYLSVILQRDLTTLSTYFGASRLRQIWWQTILSLSECVPVDPHTDPNYDRSYRDDKFSCAAKWKYRNHNFSLIYLEADSDFTLTYFSNVTLNEIKLVTFFAYNWLNIVILKWEIRNTHLHNGSYRFTMTFGCYHFQNKFQTWNWSNAQTIFFSNNSTCDLRTIPK